jgi:hypothetical protein
MINRRRAAPSSVIDAGPESLLWLHIVVPRIHCAWPGADALWRRLQLNNADDVQKAIQVGKSDAETVSVFARGAREAPCAEPATLIACFYVRHDVCGFAALIAASGAGYTRPCAANAVRLLDIFTAWAGPEGAATAAVGPASLVAEPWQAAADVLDGMADGDGADGSHFAVYGEWRSEPPHGDPLTPSVCAGLAAADGLTRLSAPSNAAFGSARADSWDRLALFAHETHADDAVHSFLLGDGGLTPAGTVFQAANDLILFQIAQAKVQWLVRWREREIRGDRHQRAIRKINGIIQSDTDRRRIVKAEEIHTLQELGLECAKAAYALKSNRLAAQIALDKLQRLRPERRLCAGWKQEAAADDADPFAAKRQEAVQLVEALTADLEHQTYTIGLLDDYRAALAMRLELQKQRLSVQIGALTNGFFFFTGGGFTIMTAFGGKQITPGYLAIPFFAGAVGYAVPILGLLRHDGVSPWESVRHLVRRIVRRQVPRDAHLSKGVAVLLLLLTGLWLAGRLFVSVSLARSAGGITVQAATTAARSAPPSASISMAARPAIGPKPARVPSPASARNDTALASRERAQAHRK